MTEKASNERLQLCRGMVLRRARPASSNEAAIVLGPAKYPLGGAFTVVHGCVDEPTTCGLFEVWPKDVPRVWRRASPDEAAQVRAFFLAHAEGWGPDSNGWVARTVPDDEHPEKAGVL